MAPSSNIEWVALRDFDDPVLAGDVVTSILAMEFDAVLVDLSSNTVVAGGSDGATAEDEGPARPFQVRARLGDFDPVLGALGTEAHVMPQGDDADRAWSSEDGGPWRILVPADLHSELDPILHVIIEEQAKFNSDHRDLQRSQARIGRFVLAVILICVAILTLRFIGII